MNEVSDEDLMDLIIEGARLLEIYSIQGFLMRHEHESKLELLKQIALQRMRGEHVH